MLRIKMEKLPQMVAKLAETTDVFLPVRQGELVNFEPYSEDKAFDLTALKTVKSPKDFFLPQSETLFTSTKDGKNINIEAEPFAEKPFVVFGVRSCDVKAMEVLDNVYLSEPVDKFYEARRKAGCLISIACAEPAATCFCKVFDIDAADPSADVAAWIVGECFYLNPKTEKGKKLTDSLSAHLETAESAAVEAQQKDIHGKIDSLAYNSLSLERFKPENLLELFDAPEWDTLHKACIACGTCTFICPTCQCYDVKDFTAGETVHRYRCWDSCMYSDFTLMAHGNIRNTQKERFRQRYMHKLVYHPDNNDGEYSCVGCGRCVNKCPVSLNIVKVIKSLGVGVDV